jgi:formate hydrogenlyase subunit 6/NADH:ubiquinone oxidoreductase subunit I
MRICPKKAVVPRQSGDQQPSSFFGSLFGARPSSGWTVDQDRCTGCLLCAQYCPHGAVVAQPRTVVG